MNNVKKNRTGLRLLGSVRGGNYRRFTMNKTQQNQPVYKNIEPRCPGAKGKRGCTDCSGSNTNVGCQTCWGCTYTFDVSSNAFTAAYPSYGDFANVNLLVDNSNNPPCEWQYNAIVEGFSFHINDPSSASVSINIEDNKCVGVQDICGVYFYPPVGGATGVYVGQFKNCNNVTEEISGNEMTVPSQNRFATTAKRMGAPYRNPIAGWRKTLDCCEDPCIVELNGSYDGGSGGYIIPGQTRFSSSNDCEGTVIYTNKQTDTVESIIIRVELDNCCCVPTTTPQQTNTIYGSNNPTSGNFQINTSTVIARETSGAAKQPTNTVYKDNYSGKKNNIGGCCATDCDNAIVHRSGIQGRTHRPIIRSGMQEKRPCCRTSTGKCNKTNDYSFSYWQYKHNKRCLDYERNLEKYVRNFPACGMFHGRFQCLNAYRKSSCCDCACEPCFQTLSNTQTGGLENLIHVGTQVTQLNTGASGIITEITYAGTVVNLVTIQNDNCDILFQNNAQGGGIVVPGPTEWTLFSIIASSGGGIAENCSSKAMAKTIYKPNNKKFSKQGAVTSGGRLERLKLDTIKSANSRCTKNATRKCIEIQSKFVGLNKTYKYPNGKYGAGKPRFTGWMFNGHHQEVKSRVYNMVRYNQQPLGIPQLTAHPPGKTCIKQCFPRTLNLGSNRSTAAGNRARIPGSKCITNGTTCNCAGCNNDPNYTNQGVPCC